MPGPLHCTPSLQQSLLGALGSGTIPPDSGRTPAQAASSARHQEAPSE